MQATELSRDLSTAIDMVEEILNSHNGADFLETLREFKETKEIDAESITNFSHHFG